MTIGQHKPPVNQVRKKSYFCDACINKTVMSQCENIANGYVSWWDMMEFIRMPPYEDDAMAINIHDAIFSWLLMCF